MHQVGDSGWAALRDKLVGWSLTGTAGVRFYLRELLGEGGQGWVYKANYDEPDGMWIVVKMLRPDSVTQETLVRFRREAEVLRFIGAQPAPSPNVVRFYDHGVASLRVPGASDADMVELPFTVLEYVDGPTLADLLQGPPARALPVSRARRILRQVVRALETVHAHRVVHRDLKPSNILIAQQAGQEIAKVTDFGLVKLVDLKLTQTAAIAGATLGYAPPEQYEHGNERVSERTDVFSLGAIVYETIGGRTAFPYQDGENPLRVITRILAGPRPSLRAASSTMAPELQHQHDLIDLLDAEVGRALQPDPAQRHATCRAFWDAVEPVLRMAEERVLRGAIGGTVPRRASDVDVSPRERSIVPAPVGAEGSVQPPLAHGPSGMRAVLRVLVGSTRGMQMRAALVGGDGSMIALGVGGLYRFAERAWSCLPPVSGMHDDQMRGMIRTLDGRILLFGDHGWVATLTHTGQIEPWGIRDPDLRLNGACILNHDTVVLVGERISRPTGVVVVGHRVANERPWVVDWPAPLRDVTRLADGSVLACGDAGTLLHLRPPAHTPLQWARTGHLYGVATNPMGGACVVGSGGHALAVSDGLDVTIERVETTRDLCAVGQDTSGVMWAAGAAGRVLRHEGPTWERVLPEYEIASRFVALGATVQGMLFLADDGLVAEVVPAG